MARYPVDLDGRNPNDAADDVPSTFTRDVKALSEREQALRLLRGVIALPAASRSISLDRIHPRDPFGPGHSRQPSGNEHSRQPSGNGHSRNPSGSGHQRNNSNKGHRGLEPDAIASLLERRIALPDGLVRAIVSCAENPDDPLRRACMETLIEIGRSEATVQWSPDGIGRAARSAVSRSIGRVSDITAHL